MDTNTTTSPEYGWPMKCVNVNALLTTITAQINDFESKQLGKLKGELEAFDKKKQAVADAYKQKYQALRITWCSQTAELETLHRTLICLFKDEWKKLITTCVCPNLSKIAEDETALQVRLTCPLGPLELKRNQAAAWTDQAKLYLDTLIANQAALERDFATNAGWIKDIKDLLQKRENAKAIYILWFKALPKQWSIASDDLRKHLKFAAGESPSDLCKPKTPVPAKDTKDGAQTPHPVPWLVDPAEYPNEIDCAWTVYWDAKKKQGEAEVAFNAKPDNVAMATKQLDDLRKTLDTRIGECLKDATPKNCGCDEPAKPAQSAEQPKAERTTDAASTTKTNQED